MMPHRFIVGEEVRLKSLYGMPPRTPDLYRIVQTMPCESGPPQYRIRSDEERHERMANEGNLMRPSP